MKMKKIKQRTQVIALLTALFSVQSATADNIKWKLPGDVEGAPNQLSFNQGMNDVWYYMQSAGLDQKESSYSFLKGFSSPCAEQPIEGLLCWYPNLPWDISYGFPWVGFNSTTTTQTPKTLTWPAHTLALHPAGDKLAIVAWKSPVNGKIGVNGSFSDFDRTCGNGVLWFINKGSTTLDSGDLSNVGEQNFNLSKISIKSGEVLYFIVDPKNGNNDCDTTGLKLFIRRGEGHSEK